MSNNIIVEKVRDSASGEVFEIRRELCGICRNVLPFSGEGHASCRRRVKEENAMELERQRRESSLLHFHEALDPTEYQIRMHPDDSFQGAEPYNKRLKREAEERKQEYYRMMAQRDEDVRRLEWLEGQIVGLRAKVTRDKELAKEEEEAAAKNDNSEKL